jgi:beta-fructofuranosidase
MTSASRSATDWQRPTYHFMPRANWMNDPNGLIQWQGKYHLFYQYNPHGAFHGTIHWGHAMSADLVSWEHLPVALAPTPNSPDQDGIYSGCAVDVEGVASILYTGVEGRAQLPCLATSVDANLENWTKYPGNPVIEAPPAEFETTIFRDHSVWKDDNAWYQAIGSGIEGVGGNAMVYRSADFQRWEFVGPLVAQEFVPQGEAANATGWECPDFFALGDRHVLIVSMWAKGAINVSYLVGSYRDHQFVPELQGLVDPGTTFYAPQSFTDDSGRRIMFGWLREARSVEAQIEAGWSGVMSLPRELSILADGSLGTAPAREVTRLRGAHASFNGSDLSQGHDLDLGGNSGHAAEIRIELRSPITGAVTTEVLRAADGRETTRITFDAATNELTVDTRDSSLAADWQGQVVQLAYPAAADRDVTLRIFVDHSVVEVFVNDEKSATVRTYPASPESRGIRVTSDGGPEAIRAIDVWAMPTE